MTGFLTTLVWLAAAEPAPPAPPQVFTNDTVIATVTGERLAEVSFVAAHAVALQRHLEFALNLPAVPGPAARLEIADVPGLPPIDTRVGAGAVLVIARLSSEREAPMRARPWGHSDGRGLSEHTASARPDRSQPQQNSGS